MCQNCEITLIGGTGTPPHRPFGAVSGTLPYTSITVCKPTPGIWFQNTAEPPRSNCGVYTRNLDDYPLNNATLYDGSKWKFGASEMILVYLYFDNYPRSGGNVKLEFKNPAGVAYFTTTQALPTPDPSWTWWYAWVWGVVGHFDNTSGYSANEIIGPGIYTTVITSPYGGAVVDYQITGTPPVDTFDIQGITAEGKIKENRRVIEWWLLATGTGTYRLYVDGDLQWGSHNYPSESYSTIFDVPAGQHTLKAVDANNSNDFASVTVNVPDIPVPSIWQCEQPLNGFERDQFGNRRPAERCVPSSEIPTILSIYAEDRGNHEGFMQWEQDIDGYVNILLDGEILKDHYFSHIGGALNLENIPYGNHTLCVQGMNQKCATVTFKEEDPITEFKLSANKTEINVGESVTLTTTGREGTIKFAQKEFIGNTILHTTTSAGNIASYTFEPAGSKTYVAFYVDALGISYWSNDVFVKVIGGTQDTDWKAYLQYIPYAIGAYLVGKLIGGK